MLLPPRLVDDIILGRRRGEGLPTLDCSFARVLNGGSDVDMAKPMRRVVELLAYLQRIVELLVQLRRKPELLVQLRRKPELLVLLQKYAELLALRASRTR